jgi:hypothetical protein
VRETSGVVVPPPTGLLKVWSGSAWVARPAKVWSGTAWAEKTVRYWTGTAWEPPSAAVSYGPDENVYPATAASGAPSDPNTFMAGIQFEVLTAGRITAIRYYQQTAVSRYVALYTDAGTVLASGTAAVGTTGWSLFPITPVNVAPGLYRVAYGYAGSAAAGTFAFAMDAIATPAAHLVWKAGVYTTPQASGGDTVFPSNVITPNHYYCDVVYQEAL